MPRFEFATRLVATVDEIKVTAWTQARTKDLALEAVRIRNAVRCKRVVVNYRGRYAALTETMSQEDFFAELEKIRLETQESLQKTH
jgi:hypothetical protein